MSVLPIYLYGSDVLRKKAKPVHELDDSLIKLAYDMSETMRKSSGIGLAATQVGDLRRVIVVDVSAAEESRSEEEEGKGEIPADKPRRLLVLLNPEVLTESGSTSIEEGCLSIPDVRADVTRAEAIRLKFRDANFREVEMDADGLLARVILHEIDHLDGILFVDRVSAAKRALLRNELRKIKKGEIDTSYPVVSAVEV
jgi:peptide deformylase